MRPALFAILLAGCSSCCHPVPNPAPPTPVPYDMARSTIPDHGAQRFGLPACPLNISVTFADVCDGMFTKTGLSCAVCQGGAACYDAVDGIYCADSKPGCQDDEACVRVQDGEDGSPGEQAKKKIKKPRSKTSTGSQYRIRGVQGRYGGAPEQHENIRIYVPDGQRARSGGEIHIHVTGGQQ